MAWKKVEIIRDNGEAVQAAAPVIISASRSTDIPAFYADWFFDRLEKGYCAWTNPFNGVQSYVSFANTRFIVFWSKNPKSLIDRLDLLKERGIGCYIQYTLNDYEAEGLEKGVPPLAQRIDTFKRLVDKLGFGRVIWRFDPLILTEEITVDSLLNKIRLIGDQLKGYTEKLVFSFADISSYKKVRANLLNNHINYREFDERTMHEFARELAEINREWGFTLATCGERIELGEYGIEHNHCVDDRLMAKYFSHDKVLMDFLGIRVEAPTIFNPEPEIVFNQDNKDKGQRQFCGCIVSKDIGQYNTCPHHCEYCYANSTKESALRNWQIHKQNPYNENIIAK